VVDATGVEIRDQAKRKLLIDRATSPDDLRLWVRSEVRLRGFVPVQAILGKSHFSSSEIADALEDLQRHQEIVIHEKIAADPSRWQMLRNRATRLIDNALDKNPERSGYNLNDLRAAFRDKSIDVFEALVMDLCSGDFIKRESTIARAAYRPALSGKLQPIAAKIHEALRNKPFDPPPRRELEQDSEAQRILKFLIESGKAIEISADAVLLRENFEQMKHVVADYISKNGPATVSELRRTLESSRRIVVPFLERLDREGFTRRSGDRRTLAGRVKP
jgi:selenocysteine-specific elongation factor